MRHTIVLFLLVAGLTAINVSAVAGAKALAQQEDPYARGISVVEEVQTLKDATVGVIRVATLDNGPAVTPVGVAVSIQAAEQGGDHLAFDTYYLNEYFLGSVTAKMVQNDLVISGSTDDLDGNAKPLVVRLKIKDKGKRLPAPVPSS